MEGCQMAGDRKTDVTDHSCPLANLVTRTFLHKLDQKVWGAALRSRWKSLLQAEQIQLPQLLLTSALVLTTLVAFHWNFSNLLVYS